MFTFDVEETLKEQGLSAQSTVQDASKQTVPHANRANRANPERSEEVSAAMAAGHPAISENSANPQVELMALIKAVGTLFAFTSEESVEATQIAFADPDGALASYRDVASRYGLSVPTARQARLP